MRCDQCGRFTSRLHDVWANPPHSIDREVCDHCYRTITQEDTNGA